MRSRAWRQRRGCAATWRRALTACSNTPSRITIAAARPEELAAQVDGVRLAAAQQGLQLAVARFQQWEGYRESLPLGREELGLAA